MKKNNKNKRLTPVATYENPDIQKDQIYSENKGKSGIYRWKNQINGKSYLGSSVDLYKRLKIYYSNKYMGTQLKRGNSAIYSSIIKYGISMFNSFDLTGNIRILFSRKMY